MCNNRCNGGCNRCEVVCDPCKKQPKMYYCGADITCVGVAKGEEISRAIRKIGDKLCQTVNQQNPLTYVNITDATEEQCETGGFVVQILQVGSDNLVSEHILCNGGDFTTTENIVCGTDIVVEEGFGTQSALENITRYFCERVNTEPTIAEDITCGEDVVVEEDTNIPTAISDVVAYFCERIPPVWGIIEIEQSELALLIENAGLQAGYTYHITDRDIFLQALETNVISTTGTRTMRIVKNLYYTPDTGILGVWNATLTPTIGDVTVWGGKVWKSLTGAVGAPIDDTALDPTDWELIPTTNETYYFTKSFGCTYDITNDWVASQWDDRGNVFTYDWYVNQNGDFFGYNPIDISDWGNNNIYQNVVYYVFNNANNFFIFSNVISSGIVNNSNQGTIYGNSNNGSISNNTNNGAIHNNINGGNISSNSNNGSISNNTNNGEIINNSNSGEISNNFNNRDIQDNENNGNIEFNSNSGTIFGIGATTTDIIYNTNNGDIVTTVVGVITDPIVNK